MRFALLGEDPLLTTLGSAVIQLGHEIVWIGETGGTNLALSIPASNREDAPWERLLDHDLADVVLVGRGRLVDRGTDEDRRADQLRKLIQAGVPILVTHPVCASMLTYFELDMVRDETQCLVQHYTPGANHPMLEPLRRVMSNEEALGPVEQVTFDRTMAHRSKEEVITQLIRDLDLMSRVVGDVNRVATLKALEPDAAYGNLSVQMATSTGMVVRWSVTSSTGNPSGCITLVGREKQAVLQMPEDLSAWSLEMVDSNGRTTLGRAPSDWDDAADAIRRVVSAIENQKAGHDESSWQAAARSVEVADAVERSMIKGRTIELHFEQFSEQSTFKGLMTSLGCGLLIAALMAMLVAGLVGDAFDLPWAGGWHFILLAVLVIFLLLQLVPRLVFGHTSKEPEDR